MRTQGGRHTAALKLGDRNGHLKFVFDVRPTRLRFRNRILFLRLTHTSREGVLRGSAQFSLERIGQWPRDLYAGIAQSFVLPVRTSPIGREVLLKIRTTRISGIKNWRNAFFRRYSPYLRQKWGRRTEWGRWAVRVTAYKNASVLRISFLYHDWKKKKKKRRSLKIALSEISKESW